MPTGYTSDIYYGKKVTLQDFIWVCARAFGACVTMRDAPRGAKIPKTFQVSTHHLKALKRAEQEFKRAQSLTASEAARLADREYTRECKRYDDRVKDIAALRRRYEDMLAQVRAWVPPTSEHTEFKKFMLDQVQGSLEFDVHVFDAPVLKTGPQYKDSRIAQAARDIAYHSASYDSEVARVTERNAWIQALRGPTACR